jgi:Domain of unknown function (DUF4917)
MPDYFPNLNNDDLADWQKVVETDLRWNGILLGNGSSRAIWDGFSYPSLYEKACSADIGNPLLGEDIALFDAFETRNFERVLASLKTAGTVAQALGETDADIRARYEHIQRALFEAVGSVHVPWDHVAGTPLLRIRSALRAYSAVYSTNYDLIAYWAIMHIDEGAGFKDLFWGPGNSFDPKNASVSGNATLVYYLHGGVHLRALVDGGTRKHVSELGALLDDFPTSFESDEVPLLISEGSAQDKRDAILRSDYLSFAYGRLAQHDGGLVIFGQSLGEEDDHLVDVLNSWRPPWHEPVIAISIRRTENPDDARVAKLHYADRLPYADLLFFDPDTHPLGQSHVRPA